MVVFPGEAVFVCLCGPDWFEPGLNPPTGSV